MADAGRAGAARRRRGARASPDLLRWWVAKEATLKLHDARLTRCTIAVRPAGSGVGRVVAVDGSGRDGSIVAAAHWTVVAHRFVVAVATLPAR